MAKEHLTMREAVADDVAVLAKHRRWMFEDMQRTQGHSYLVEDLEAMEQAYVIYLQERLGKEIRAWVTEANGSVVASGAILFQLWAPRPGDRTGRSALLHSIYTAPEFRRQGLARRITEQLVAMCRELGLKTVNLHASQAGRPLYESLGFRPTSEMRLVL